ncbi:MULTISPECIES: AP2 domain-containing protein [Variovorax]|uniref:AP2 domain-containing protein n=1 Tax=Variovorax TaxID=34072 RepID=UPI0021AC8F73|nr:AP2 domain-containing protein [Variovorax paradoxus]UVH58309.1 AP2 domain-containing protein [Variovorax paradoxus]
MPKGIPNPAAMYGIYSRSWGFEVSIVRNGVRHHRLFGKASYGGAEQALLHAQDWRDFIVRSVPPQARRERAEKHRTNNSTGVTGVFHHLAPGGRVRAWMAKTYIAPDEILRTDFSVADLGDDAQALAIQERAQQLKRMTGLARIHPAEEAIRMGLSAHPPGPRTAKRSKSEITRRNNTSGVSGVHFKTPNPSHPGYWLAITYSTGKGSVSKAFSVKVHGAEMAKSLAIAERTSQLAEKLRAEEEAAAQPASQRKPRARAAASSAKRNNG